jgi:hypothetical protein
LIGAIAIHRKEAIGLTLNMNLTKGSLVWHRLEAVFDTSIESRSPLTPKQFSELLLGFGRFIIGIPMRFALSLARLE